MPKPSLRKSFLRHVAQTSPSPDGFEVSHGEGLFLYDINGQPFYDCISGIAVSAFGHQHPAIKKAISDQLDAHLHTMVYGEHIQSVQVRLAERIASLLPENLSVSYFTNSGTEAVEGAIKLARKYTSRYEIIACRNAYHGSTSGAESLRSDIAHTSAFRPLVPGVKHIDFNALEDLNLITTSVAAVIVEPIQGEAGVMVPQQDYLARLKDRCRKEGVLLIADEIQTGMGRTGSLFAFQQLNFIPDILLLAKAFGGGMPLGAFISSPEIMKALSVDPILGHLSTFGGHPLSCAASLASFDIIEQESLLDHVKNLGDYFKVKLSSHPAVKEVRGAGLMLAIELNRDSVMEAVQQCRENGVLVDWFLFNSNSIRFYPPLVMTEEHAEIVADKILDAFSN